MPQKTRSWNMKQIFITSKSTLQVLPDCHKWNLGLEELCQIGCCRQDKQGHLARNQQHEKVLKHRKMLNHKVLKCQKMLNHKVLKCPKMLNHRWVLGGQLFEEHWLSDYYSGVISTNKKSKNEPSKFRKTSRNSLEPKTYPSRLSSIAALY